MVRPASTSKERADEGSHLPDPMARPRGMRLRKERKPAQCLHTATIIATRGRGDMVIPRDRSDTARNRRKPLAMSNHAPAVVEQDPGDRLPATPTRSEEGGSDLPPWQHWRATRAKNLRDGAILGAAAPQRTPPRMRDGGSSKSGAAAPQARSGAKGEAQAHQSCDSRRMDLIISPHVRADLSKREMLSRSRPIDAQHRHSCGVETYVS